MSHAERTSTRKSQALLSRNAHDAGTRVGRVSLGSATSLSKLWQNRVEIT